VSHVIIDAAEGILGRVAAFAAKQALLGNEVIVVNCNDVLITGNKKGILEKYKSLRNKAGWSLKGPKIHRSPEKTVKRTVRGMLPHKKGRGLESLRRIRCYNAVPAEFADKEKKSLKRDLKVKAVKLSKIMELT